MSANVSVLENYDDLLGAVKETSRGRAFLEEFTLRSRRADTDVVLNAIQKIETVINDVGLSSQFAPVINDARQSISSIRKEIVGLANAATLPETTLSARIAAALKLVDDLDKRIQTPNSLATQTAPLAQYFGSDSDIFVSVEPKKIDAPISFEKPTAKPFIVPPVAAAPISTVAQTPDLEPKRGATLTISRSKPTPEVVAAAIPAPMANETVIEEIAPISEIAGEIEVPQAIVPTYVKTITEPEAASAEEDLPAKRVVIIRRAVGETAEIPFMNDTKKENAA